MTPAPQPVTDPTTRDAIFIVLTVNPGDGSRDAVRAACADLPGLVRAVGQRDAHGQLSCVAAFGSEAWDRLFGPPRPAELHPLAEVGAAPRLAVSTPGDILLHIRAERMDLCFELALQIMSAPRRRGDRRWTRCTGSATSTTAISPASSTAPRTPSARMPSPRRSSATRMPPFAGGSYVLVQRYVHDLATWDALTTEEQELIIGRTKLSDIELDDAVKPLNAHNALTVIEEGGEEVDILRHNMPYGDAALGESGTYFIGYARSPHVLEQMLENMFVGRPPGNYDRLLDFTHAVTGSSFFAPSLSFSRRSVARPVA